MRDCQTTRDYSDQGYTAMCCRARFEPGRDGFYYPAHSGPCCDDDNCAECDAKIVRFRVEAKEALAPPVLGVPEETLVRALKALEMDPVGVRLAWSPAQFRARAAAREALRSALGGHLPAAAEL